MDNVFERWSSNLKPEIITIPLCTGTLKSGTLENPRFEPQAEYGIFMDDNGEFDSILCQSAIMLYDLLDMLKAKMTKFIFFKKSQ